MARRVSVFELWQKDNVDIIPLLKAQVNVEQSPEKLFRSKRKSVHAGIAERLSEFIAIIRNELKHAKSKEAKHELEVIKPIDKNITSTSKILVLRKLKFLETEVLSLRRRLLKWKVQFFETKERQAMQFFRLVAGNFAPENCIFTISSEFFIHKMPGEEPMLSRIKYLRMCRNRLREDVSHMKKSKFIRDLNSSFRLLVSESVVHYDNEIGIFPSSKREPSFTRAVLGTKRGELIDKFISDTNDNSQLFRTRIAGFCCGLVKDFKSLPQNEQNVAMMLYFRIIVNRAYELSPSLHGFVGSSCLAAFSARTDQMVIPAGIHVGDFDLARNAFYSHPGFKFTADILTETIFHTDPIEILNIVQKSINKNHETTVKLRIGREPTQKDLMVVMGFDDQFAALLGCVLASDVFDIDRLFAYVSRVLPRGYITPLLEYAMANLEGINIEIKSLTERLSCK